MEKTLYVNWHEGIIFTDAEIIDLLSDPLAVADELNYQLPSYSFEEWLEINYAICDLYQEMKEFDDFNTLDQFLMDKYLQTIKEDIEEDIELNFEKIEKNF